MFLKGGLCLGLALTLMLSGTSCGKKQVEVTDYGSESDNTSGTISDDASDSDSDEATNASSSDYENLKSDGRSFTEIFGNNISVNEAFSAGGITADFDFDYKVPEASQVNVYEGVQLLSKYIIIILP